jgi:hypothetical protein
MPLSITWVQLIYSALFAFAFGVVEGIAVVYLRTASGVAAGYGDSMSAAMRFAESFNPAILSARGLPVGLAKTEMYREAATMIMLVSVAAIAASTRSERWAIFLWTFAIWDLSYYATLFVTIRWPSSLSTPDVLFLLPVPWVSAVWLPLLISTLSVLTVALLRRRRP